MSKVSLFTLGCKLNQFETAYIADLFKDMGYEQAPFPSKADVYLINTCAVTSKSQKHSYQAVRRAIRGNPDGIVIVTGCAAQVDPNGFGSISGVDLVVGNREKAHILSFLDGLKKGEPLRVKVCGWGQKNIPLFPMSIKRFTDYTRSFIKVQEGCDAHCTYCIVPKARGPARSVPVDEVVSQVLTLWGSGYREIVLTGIHLGQYGKDLHPRNDLCGLLDRLLSDNRQNRLRLSSIESSEFSERLFDLIGSAPNLCPHFHVPLQSGSKRILERMGRPYTPEEYSDVIYRINQRNPLSAIGADVMTGFPGETGSDFEMTCRLIDTLPLAYLHVFSYSPRPGTLAELMPDQVDIQTKKERSLYLRRIGRIKRGMFRSRFIGKELKGLVLNQSAPEPGYKVALTGNYIPVYIKAGADKFNKMVMVRVEKVAEEGTWGKITAVLG
ncbi:tRNA (N(6)-L-threonylcarbamoyladenosine(37)-C(2))-methylthiotransferase MtaB [bacterium]|nr:tRNA (N(6)-L-threonylcarbamoyladenosine(37)-C(2))-methylthiotransferase MtaB [bacterium]